MLFAKYCWNDEMKGSRHMTCVGEMRNVYTIFIRTLGRKETTWKVRCWEDNIKMVLKGIGQEDVDVTYPQGQTSVVNSSEHSNECTASIKGGEFPEQLCECWLHKKDCFMKLVRLVIYQVGLPTRCNYYGLYR